ncbi:septation protein A [Candidatus Methylocalor cossyra]|uniref:Inner membrane-spanning protein YciB n=1 Tax=Candidatus Methylocalor cossyra TaxID=3108543 RepID=A0ABM9NHJ7_9GAMM
MKLLFDFFPIVLFFVTYKFGSAWVPEEHAWLKDNPIYLATLVAIAATVVQVGHAWIRQRKVENMHWWSLALIVGFGGATLYLKDPIFIKWKPTVLDWLLAALFLGSQALGGKPLIERMLGGQLELPAHLWRRLNMAWSTFFVTMGGLNLYVAYRFEETTWVNFKLFGVLGLTVLFVILQSLYLSRYLPEPKPEK